MDPDRTEPALHSRTDPAPPATRIAELERRVGRLAGDAASARAALAEADADLTASERLLAGAVVVVADQVMVRVNPATCELLGYHDRDLIGQPIAMVWPGFVAGDRSAQVRRHDTDWRRRDGELIPVEVATAHGRIDCERLVCVASDRRVQQRQQIERDHAGKLEVLGQLAAGVAHEINTPMQFIGDNLHLLRQGFDGGRLLIDRLRVVLEAARAARLVPELIDDADQAEIASGWDFLADRLERAFTRVDDGVARVTEIVRALRLFSHPDNQLAAVDVNQALRTTLTVADPVLREVATVTTELDELPAIAARPGDLNQVFLNLLVNAAHAIAATGRGRGTITVRTRALGDRVSISISDDGCGMPGHIQPRIFDPFFTTKPPGQGTGQGLALVHAVVVERHAGTIQVDSQVGCGTTFHVERRVGTPSAATPPPELLP